MRFAKPTKSLDQAVIRMVNFKFKIGYTIFIRFEDLRYPLDDDVPWSMVVQRKRMKMDLSFRVASPSTVISSQNIFMLARFVLRPRQSHKIILRLEGHERLVPVKELTTSFFRFLYGRQFDFMYRRTPDAVRKLKDFEMNKKQTQSVEVKREICESPLFQVKTEQRLF